VRVRASNSLTSRDRAFGAMSVLSPYLLFSHSSRQRALFQTVLFTVPTRGFCSQHARFCMISAGSVSIHRDFRMTCTNSAFYLCNILYHTFRLDFEKLILLQKDRAQELIFEKKKKN
jgi:hypothetical protein